MQALNIPKITIPYHMEKHFINRHSLEEQDERPQFWMRVVRCHTSAVHRQIHKTCLIWPGRIGCRCSTPRACSIGAASWGLLYSKTLLKWPISKNFDPRTGTQCTYSILGSRKYHWPVLRVPFGGDIHLFLICEEIPNQILWITKYLDSGLNSDLIKKKNCRNRMCLDCYR